MASCEDVVGFLLLVYRFALVYFSLLLRLLNSHIIFCISPKYMHDCHATFLSNFHCSKMLILWASCTCTMGFMRCPGFKKIVLLNLHKCTYLVNESDCSN